MPLPPAFTSPELDLIRSSAEKGQVGLRTLGTTLPDINVAVGALNAAVATLRTKLQEIGGEFAAIGEANKVCHWVPAMVEAVVVARNEATEANRGLAATHNALAEARLSADRVKELLGHARQETALAQTEVSELRAREQGYRQALLALQRAIPSQHSEMHQLIQGVL